MSIYANGVPWETLNATLNANNYGVSNSYPFIRSLIANNRLFIPTMAGWTAAVANNGTTTQVPNYIEVTSSATANGEAVLSAYVHGLNSSSAAVHRVDFTKKLYISFILRPVTGSTNSKIYVQLKQVSTHGVLAALGLGIVVKNLAIYGNSYGSGAADTETDLTKTLTSQSGHRIEIIHLPGTSIEWKVDGTSEVTLTTTANIPNAVAAADCYLVLSVNNGGDLTSTVASMGALTISQE